MISFLAVCCVFLPFLAGAITFAASKKIITPYLQNFCISMQGLTAVLSFILLILFLHHPTPLFVPLFHWMKTSFISISWGIYLDKFTVFFLALLNILSFFIFIYSISYMMYESSRTRFYIHLSFLISAMAFFITSESLIQLLFGWTFMGIFSFLLIGFRYDHTHPTKAAYKFFIINRIGDITLLGGIIALFLTFHDFSLANILNNLTHSSTLPPLHNFSLLSLASVLFIIAAMAKSAQFGFHTWLSDATEAPVPVSALLHSVTIVTAGVFLLIKLWPLLSLIPFIKYVLLSVGIMSALFGATTALTQTNCKRILALSSISQVGLMIIAIALGSYWVAFFHLVIHAVFKSLLFLGVGSIIYACEGESNIFEMPKLKFSLPFTYSCLWVGILSLGGMPLFAGFFSQEKILEASLQCRFLSPNLIFLFLETIAFLTIYYGARLMFVIFHEKNKHRVETPLKTFSWISALPVSVLALASMGLGYIIMPYFAPFVSSYWSLPLGLTSLVINALGITLCALLYMKFPFFLRKALSYVEKLYLFLKHEWYIENLYNVLFVKPFEMTGRFLSEKIDLFFIDKICIEGLLRGIKKCNEGLGSLQSGNIAHYILAMTLGVIILIGYLFW